MLNIFYNIEPKVINTELACLIGLNEAIVLQQFHYWIEKNKATGTNLRDGHTWTYGTVQEYRDRDFKFWSFDTVKRTLAKLVSLGFLIKGNYNRVKLDHTAWYTIDYSAISEWIENNTAAQPGGMPSSNRAKCPNRTGQNAPIVEGKMPSSDRAECPNRTVQLAPKEQGNLPHAIQENIPESNTKRIEQVIHTHTPPPPTATGESVNTPTVPFSASAVEEVMDTADILFNKFWELYPRKESKRQALRAWKALNPDQELFNLIANALEYRSQTKEWLAEDGRYIPHPASWLNSRRWEDEQDPQKICKSAHLQAKFGDILVDGKPLDPIQKYQLAYLENELVQMGYNPPE